MFVWENTQLAYRAYTYRDPINSASRHAYKNILTTEERRNSWGAKYNKAFEIVLKTGII